MKFGPHFQYKILIGETPNDNKKNGATLFSERLTNLEIQVNRFLRKGGKCAGGLYIKDNMPYQAVTYLSSSASDPTPLVTTAVRSAAGGGGERKTRKNRK
jgi:hypothetical protein